MIPLSSYERLSGAQHAPVHTFSRRDVLRCAVAVLLRSAVGEGAQAPAAGVRCDRSAAPLAIADCAFDGTTPITCMVTCTPETVDGERTLVGDQHDAGFCLRICDGYAEFLCHNGRQYVTARSDKRLDAGTPVTIIGRCDGRALELFVNGVRQRHMPRWQGRYRPSAHTLHVGADPDGNDLPQHPFVGFLHEVRLRGDARSDRDGKPVLPREPDKADLLWLDAADVHGGVLPDKSRFRRMLAVEPDRLRLPPDAEER